mgnify:CR=1 FL=1
MMINNRWRLYSVEQPDEDGIYDVRLSKKYDPLSSPVETLMEYKDGEWLLRVPAFTNEYEVTAWRYR